MMTRPQVESLLGLAEAIERCGVNGLTVCVPNRCNVVVMGGSIAESLNLRTADCSLNAMELRLLLSDLVPKHTGS